MLLHPRLSRRLFLYWQKVYSDCDSSSDDNAHAVFPLTNADGYDYCRTDADIYIYHNTEPNVYVHLCPNADGYVYLHAHRNNQW